MQALAKTRALQIDVAAKLGELFVEGGLIGVVGECVAQELRQIEGELAGARGVGSYEVRKRIEQVEEEVRLELVLQGLQTRVARQSAGGCGVASRVLQLAYEAEHAH